MQLFAAGRCWLLVGCSCCPDVVLCCLSLLLLVVVCCCCWFLLLRVRLWLFVVVWCWSGCVLFSAACFCRQVLLVGRCVMCVAVVLECVARRMWFAVGLLHLVMCCCWLMIVVAVCCSVCLFFLFDCRCLSFGACCCGRACMLLLSFVVLVFGVVAVLSC